MSIHVKLDLSNPAELEAFGTFCTAVAAARRAEPPRQTVYDLLGSISREPGIWQRAKMAVDPAEGSDTSDAVAFAQQQVFTQPAHDQDVAAAPKRERGQPSPGKKRRTAAEIAEDEAAAAAPTIATMVTLPDNSTPEQVAEAFAGLKGNISASPEDRQDPNNPEPTDDEATAEQDAADEAAETAATKTGLTLDDVRDVIGIYVKAYGMAAAQEDGPKIITAVCGEGKIKVSDIPEDKIEAVIAEVKKAGKENRYGRTAVAA